MQPGNRNKPIFPRRRDILTGAAALAALLSNAGSLAAMAPAEAGDADRALTEGFAALGSELYAALSEKPGNIVFSPHSIGIAMAMTLSGARGSTGEELAKVLQLRLSRAEIEKASGKVTAALKSYNKSAGLSLLIANALMLAGYGGLVSGEYRALIKERYAGEVFPDATLEKVNGWVKDKTNGKIEKILDSLGQEPALVLLNAVYFKAAWATPFSKGATQDAFFNLTSASSVKTPTMYREDQFKLVTRPGYRAISLPYAGGALSMIAVLPDRVDGLHAVAGSLKGGEAAKLLSAFAPEPLKRVALTLPRFKSNSDIDLIEPFRKLGLKIALTDNADFGGILGARAGKEGIKIGQVRHRAVIEVAEEGTEAAAATAVVGARSLAMKPAGPAEAFTVDRPFMFFVAGAASGAVLFQGRVADPSRLS